jgi:putative NADPH-quinone reductase
MTARRILIIQGHPDPDARHLCHALEDAYAAGAIDAGHAVRRVNVAKLDFPILRSQADWDRGPVPPALASVQADILWAQHLVLFFPLWLGGLPAHFKGFLEQVARPGFAFTEKDGNPFGRKGLTGRSARVVVTLGMPTIVYRWYFRASGVQLSGAQHPELCRHRSGARNTDRRRGSARCRRRGRMEGAARPAGRSR